MYIVQCVVRSYWNMVINEDMDMNGEHGSHISSNTCIYNTCMCVCILYMCVQNVSQWSSLPVYTYFEKKKNENRREELLSERFWSAWPRNGNKSAGWFRSKSIPYVLYVYMHNVQRSWISRCLPLVCVCGALKTLEKPLTKFKVASFKFECVIKVHKIHLILWARMCVCVCVCLPLTLCVQERGTFQSISPPRICICTWKHIN